MGTFDQLVSRYPVIGRINEFIINPLILLLAIIGLVWFLWGVLQFINAAQSGDAAGQQQGKKHMVYGIIGLFIMVAAWGILNLISGTIIDLIG